VDDSVGSVGLDYSLLQDQLLQVGAAL